MRILIFLLPIILFAQSWDSYPYYPPGAKVQFPQDDGAHLDTINKTEWWYLNAHVETMSGKRYHLMLCYFRKPIEFRIFNITCSTDSSHTSSVLPFPTSADYDTTYWGITWNYNGVIDSSFATYRQDSVPYKYVFIAKDTVNDNEIRTTVRNKKKPLIVGGDGWIPLGENGDSSYYYSYAYMSIEGTIKYKGTKDSIKKGIAWIDRQWGPFVVGIAGNDYEWFSFQVDDTSAFLAGTPQNSYEMNIWQIFKQANDVPFSPNYRSVSILMPNDNQDTSSNFIFERTKYWYDPVNSKYYSAGWRLIDTKNNICLEAKPLLEDQVVDVIAFKFWEGPIKLYGSINSNYYEGLGFAELVTNIQNKIIPPGPPANVILSGNIISWERSSQGSFPVKGYRIYKAPLSNPSAIEYLGSTQDSFFVLSQTDTSMIYAVSSYDDRTATNASEITWATKTSGINYLSDNFRIYPNPADNFINITTTTKLPVSYKLYNSIGKLILSGVGNKINVSSVAPGMYILEIGNTYHKVLINH